MASIDTLPPDQRAVLQLVLERGRTYDEIAKLLSIDRAAVRQRALDALDQLGPQTRVPPERRALITDYLLGQLPPKVTQDTHDRLAQSAGERAWGRVLASELAPLARDPLPEIPVESAAREPGAADASATREPTETDASATRESTSGPDATPARRATPTRRPTPEPSAEPAASAGAAARQLPRRAPAESKTPAESEAPASGFTNRPAPSWVGGATLLALAALVVAIVVVVIIASNSGSGSHPSRKAAGNATSTSTATTTTATQVLAKDTLASPSGSKQTIGVAEVFRVGAATGLLIVGQGVPANTTHDAYAVWLYNSPSDSHLLGFVNPGVTSDGKLQTEGPLPANASHYKQLLVTSETQAKPSGPGKTVLKGALNVS